MNVVVLHGIRRLFLLLFALYFVSKVERFVRKGIVRWSDIRTKRARRQSSVIINRRSRPSSSQRRRPSRARLGSDDPSLASPSTPRASSTPRARRTTDRSRVRLASTRVVQRRVSRRDVPIRNHAERDRSRLSRDLRATPRARRETRRRARLGRGDAPKTRSSAIYVDEVTADVKVDVRATENADARETRVERARSVDTFTRERRRRDRGRRAIVARNDRVNITRSIRRANVDDAIDFNALSSSFVPHGARWKLARAPGERGESGRVLRRHHRWGERGEDHV